MINLLISPLTFADTKKVNSFSTAKEQLNSGNRDVPKIYNNNHEIINIGKMIWHDEFQLFNDDDWTKNIGTYSNFLPTINSPSNVQITPKNQGSLRILTSKIAKPSYYTGLCAGKPCEFQSGEISTRNKLSLRYGFLEARIRVPEGSGNFPAFWLCPKGNFGDSGKPTPGEIDVMEWYGNTPSKIWSTLHFPSGLNGEQANDEFRTSDYRSQEAFSESFHLFGMNWQPDRISFYVDRNLFVTFKREQVTIWPFTTYFYIILNGNVGPQPNSDLGGIWTGTGPSSYEVDWIRYWSAENRGSIIHS